MIAIDCWLKRSKLEADLHGSALCVSLSGSVCNACNLVFVQKLSLPVCYTSYRPEIRKCVLQRVPLKRAFEGSQILGITGVQLSILTQALGLVFQRPIPFKRVCVLGCVRVRACV